MLDWAWGRYGPPCFPITKVGRVQARFVRSTRGCRDLALPYQAIGVGFRPHPRSVRSHLAIFPPPPPALGLPFSVPGPLNRLAECPGKSWPPARMAGFP